MHPSSFLIRRIAVMELKRLFLWQNSTCTLCRISLCALVVVMFLLVFTISLVFFFFFDNQALQ